MRCTYCGGEMHVLGMLGRLLWRRCRSCHAEAYQRLHDGETVILDTEGE